MDCQDVQKFLQAYLDGELEGREGSTILAHLEGCESCRGQIRLEKAVRRRLKDSLPLVKAPASLRARTFRALDRAKQVERPAQKIWRLIPAAAAVVLMAGVLFSQQETKFPTMSLIEQSVAGHRQELPLDVKGSNPDAVQQFFRNKVDFAVRPPRFTSQRVQLVGARLTNLREHQAVKVTYLVDGQRVSVFIFDSQAVPRRGNRRLGARDVYWQGIHGYNVALYRSGGTGYAVTSDMAPGNLVQLISHSY